MLSGSSESSETWERKKPWQPETWQDSTLFLRPEFGNFLPFCGDFHTNYTVKQEKREKIHWRKLRKSSGDGAPKSQISVPCRGQTKIQWNNPTSVRPFLTNIGNRFGRFSGDCGPWKGGVWMWWLCFIAPNFSLQNFLASSWTSRIKKQKTS